MGKLDEFLNSYNANPITTLFLLLLLLYINGKLLDDNDAILLKDHIGVLLTPSGKAIRTSYFVRSSGVASGNQSWSPPPAIRALALSLSVFSVFDYECVPSYEGECLRRSEPFCLRQPEYLLYDIILYHFFLII